MNYDEVMFRVQKALLNMWEYLPTLVNLASDWLRAEGSLVDEEEIKINEPVTKGAPA